MFRFSLNGQEATAAEDKNLLEYLREDARLTSAKNGCGEGPCGACMVLVDGKAIRACLLTTAKAQGKTVTTVEGLSPREKDIFVRAFGEAGAVQCGFCIPGMVISAKALLDHNPDPTLPDVKAAIKPNICRCTGYAKIEQAILMAGKWLREDNSTQSLHGAGADASSGESQAAARVGTRLARLDVRAKVLGEGQYVDDVFVEGMLYAGVLRAPRPRVRIKRIDISAARRHPGIAAVLTAADVPGERLLGHLVHDWPVLIAEGEETRYVGDALALIAGSSADAVEQAVRLIAVEYEELCPIITPRAALAEGAPKIHPKGNLVKKVVMKRGDADAAIARASHVVTQTYKTPPTEHAFLEPESALAVPEKDGTLTVYTGGQSVYDEHRGIVEMLGVAPGQVRVISKLVGGAFGGKEDLSVQHHAALLAWHTGRPVKLTLSRQESIRVHPKRHAMEIELTTACDEQGKITAVKASILSDGGAYASLSGPVLQRACTHAAGPYQIENVDITGFAAYTNNPPAGAFRGFGVTQSCFAMETNVNLLAERVGISPWEIRYRNAIEPGKVLTNGQIADEGTALKESLLAVKDVFESHPGAGIACAFKNSGLGVGVPDVGRVALRVRSGEVVICTSAACMGQGLATVLLQIVSEACGVAPELIRVHAPDTRETPDSGTTTASRQTLFAGEAARLAALALKQDLVGQTLADLEGRDYYREYHGITDPMESDKQHRVSHVTYSYAVHVAILDARGHVQKIVAAHDVGKAINPTSLEGQIQGGVVMSLGWALTEDFPLVNGVPTAKFGTLGLLRSTRVPEIECIIIEKNPDVLAYGAKGIGEIAGIPTAPAVAAAYYSRDRRLRTRLPLAETPYRKSAES